MNTHPLSSEGLALQQKLHDLEQFTTTLNKKENDATKIHVAGVGKTLSTAYEQLRNAAEYTEEHLLLQRTIRRFFRRNLSFYEKRTAQDIGEELIIELTQSGYLENDTIPKTYIAEIESFIFGYYDVYWQLKSHRVPTEKAMTWTLDMLSVNVEGIFHKADAEKATLFANFAYDHFFEALKKTYTGEEKYYDDSLFIAIHRSLLKSDLAATRAGLTAKHKEGFADLAEYVKFNRRVDTLFEAQSTDLLVRYINKNGAPLRILNKLIDEYSETTHILKDRASLLNAIETQTEKEYQSVKKKINRGVIKSIAFLFITKVLVGLAIEIPYDLYVHHMIVVLPLVVNLLFPPLYMAVLRFSMKLPGRANTDAIREYLDNIFFRKNGETYNLYAKTKKNDSSPLLNILYGVMFLFVFGMVGLRLWTWDFSLVHIAIFFLFLSTASFLGFRLSRSIRELEVVSTNQGGIAIVRDFMYMPFILVGRWISDKYARVNIIALVLDMAIELPLKTFLRLTRQWTKFLNDKKDEL